MSGVVNHYVTQGNGKCSKCGKNIKYVHHIDGMTYGSECAKEALGRAVSAPGWLYEMAEQYVRSEVTKQSHNASWYAHVGDLSVNFYGSCYRYEGTNLEYADGRSKLWNGPVKIKGKRITVEAQYEISYYLNHRYSELTNRKYDEHGMYVQPPE